MSINLRNLILNKLRSSNSVKAAEIIRVTGFSREYVNRFFRALVVDGKILLVGKANQAHYILSNRKSLDMPQQRLLTISRLFKNYGLQEDVVLADIKKSSGILVGLPGNISRIFDYAFTEMLNNAIDHSQSKNIAIKLSHQDRVVTFTVVDKGVGIFNNIRRKRKLHNTLEAIQDLLKGKQTTAPSKHSGEGIFFTSKVADVLTIQSSGKKLIFDNLVNDVFIREVKSTIGTKVVFSVNLKSKVNLHEVFRQFSGQAYTVVKTKVAVKLYELGSEYISRSQAKRIMSGLEKFKHIVLDFKDVKTVGQGFADEVFRVWKNNNSHIIITTKNTNENVDFMIKRVNNW